MMSKQYNRCIKCGIRQHENFENVSFHNIRPENERLWLECLGLNVNTTITSKSRVCSRHFDESSYKNPKSKLKRLNDDARPHNRYPTLPVSISSSMVF